MLKWITLWKDERAVSNPTVKGGKVIHTLVFTLNSLSILVVIIVCRVRQLDQ
jgi:hypothetical protein